MRALRHTGSNLKEAPTSCLRTTLIHLGLALWAENAWLLATLAVAFALMHFVVVPREERYKTGRFGEEYLAYRSSVRRWL